MSNIQTEQLLQMETTCGSLLCELKIIWDEVGETDKDRDKMLLELEQECLEIYRRKVDQANRCRAQLRQAIADSEAELAAICSAMGERPVHIRQSDQSAGSLKEELSKIIPQLEEMQKRKVERKNQFLEVVEQIQIISSEINGSTSCISSKVVVDETDLSLRRLEELHRQLHALQTDKSDRLKQIQVHLGTLNSLCLVLGMDFKQTISEIHPSLDNSEGCKDISLDLIERLATAIKKFRDVKIQRMQRLQDLATTMLELWNLMDTPIEEQQMFQNITCNIAASEHEITEPDTLSVDFINYVEAEVSRLEELKSSKMKELVLKKRTELEEICRKTHMVIEADSAIEYAIEAIESGVVDPSCVLDQIEVQVAKVKEEAFSRKDILERVDKWLFACDEECWLEEYNRDENRYNAGRGAHLTLKRAEKARALVNKLPAMVDALASKTIAWEKERGTEFNYDGVRLLSMLEEYTILRDEKEQERRRQRDQKKLQGQLMAEQEALYGSKPSPSKSQSVKKGPRMSTGGASNRRLSMQAPKADSIHSTRVSATPLSRPSSRKSDRGHQFEHDDGLTDLATGRRNLSRNSSFGSNYEPESPMMRKPFAPISLPAENGTFATPMKSTNVPEEDYTKTPKTPKVMSFVPATLQTVSVPMQTAVTPAPPSHQPIPYAANVAKEVASEEIEYTKTPKVMSFVPTTPQTVSVPMQTAVTPAPPSHQPIPYAANVAKEVSPEEIEYSFEEIRAGFMLPSAHRICSTLW